MANLYIEEYRNILQDGSGDAAQAPGKPLGAEPVVKVDIGATTARNSVDFNSGSRFLIITCDADCQFEIGDSTITADTNSQPLWTGTYRTVEVKESDTRIAVIAKQ